MSLGYGYAKKTSSTGDGVAGTSGTPKEIGGLFVLDDGTATTVKLYDGTSTGGTLVFQVVTTANVPTNLWFPGGLVFPSGCFIDVDTHTALAVVAYKEIR